MRDADRFIGSGWSFPVRIGNRGGIVLTNIEDEIVASITCILGTAPGERVMRPDFGCSMWDQAFDGTDPNTLGLVAQAVREALGRWEPRIELEAVDTSVARETPNRIDIGLAYTIKATNDRRNLVHPFYVIPRDDGGG